MLPDTTWNKHIEVSQQIDAKQSDANMDQFFVTPASMQLVKTHKFLL